MEPGYIKELLFSLRLLHDSLTDDMQKQLPFPSFRYEIGFLRKGMEHMKLLSSKEIDFLLSII